MGLFSSIGNVFSSVTDALSPVTDLFSSVGSLASGASSAYSLYNTLSGGDLSSQKELMDYQAALQDAYWRSQYGSRHQLEVEDLKEAGLNPILSAIGSSGSAGGVSASAVPNSTRAQKIMASAAATQAYQQARMFDSSSAKNFADADLNRALVYRANTEAGLMDRYQYWSEQESKARIRNLDAQTYNTVAFPANQGRIAKEVNSLAGLWRKYGSYVPRSSARSLGFDEYSY